MKEENALEVENLSASFNGQIILDGLNFSVKRGDVLSIVGPNGAGKSVLFRALLGLIPFSGSINWKPGVKIGYVPQKLSIDSRFPLTALEFLLMKIKNNRGSENDINRVLNAVGIKTSPSNEHHLEHHFLNRPLGQLSGGELQRILIAWSMIDNPDILLFDEPTTGIDTGGEETIYNLLRKLQQSATLTILLISHELNIVYKYSDNVLCLNKKQICFGKPSVVLDPKELSSLYGEANFFRHEHIDHI